MKRSYRAKALRTLTKTGSLVFCENCKRILGSINEKGYRYINLSINCNCDCDEMGSLEIVTEASTSDLYEAVNRMPKSKNGLAVCGKCGMPMFGIIDDRVKGYSFYVECVCGEKYDLKSTFPQRLGETLDTIKKEL